MRENAEQGDFWGGLGGLVGLALGWPSPRDMGSQC
jgi:hypothetical protein